MRGKAKHEVEFMLLGRTLALSITAHISRMAEKTEVFITKYKLRDPEIKSGTFARGV